MFLLKYVLHILFLKFQLKIQSAEGGTTYESNKIFRKDFISSYKKETKRQLSFCLAVLQPVMTHKMIIENVIQRKPLSRTFEWLENVVKHRIFIAGCILHLCKGNNSC